MVAPAKILIVDDDDASRQLMLAILKQGGYAPLAVASGKEALAALTDNSAFDMIILGSVMPGMGGFAALEKIKRHPAIGHTRVMVLTAANQVEDRIKALFAGATDYIAKPFETDEFLARLQTQIDLKRTRDALQESKNRYRMLAESMQDLIIRLNPDGIFSYVSPACETVLGFTANEMQGQSFYSYLHPEDLADIGQMDPPLLDPSVSSVFVVRFKTKNDTHLWLEWSLSKIETAPTAEMIAVGRDVTERKLYEGALQQAYDELEIRVEERTRQLSASNELLKQEVRERVRAEAELEEERTLLTQRVEERTAELRAANVELSRAAQLKDEFLASMSHELRTPLNAVLGMSEALQEQVFGPLNAEQLNSLKIIEDSGRHLLSLINDILDLSKIEAGKLVLDPMPVAVGTLCHASLQFIKQEAAKKHLKISSTLDSAVEVIWADERRLKQILVNLLSNAVKFTLDGGTIGLEVDGDADAEVAHFTVWDTGIGIEETQMAKLFKPFIQLDSRLARQYNGTGLGLVLVQRMAEMHGGSVSLESDTEQGSRFTVSLPWKPQTAIDLIESAKNHPVPAETITPSMPRAGQVRILLAEDNEINIHTLSPYLKAKGYHLTIAKNGVEAITQAHAVEPDLILMDIQMPELDGLGAIRHLRVQKLFQHTPIIALTALTMPGDRERCLSAGATDYMSKPVSLKNLTATINKLLRQQTSPTKE